MNKVAVLAFSLLANSMILAQAPNPNILSPMDIMERYGKTVVLITTITKNKEVRLGSGFIIKSDGVIITNFHVMKGGYPAFVKTRSGDVYDEISVIDFDEKKDIAIIKIKGFDLPKVILGNSNNIKVGERVIVIGNPEGLENSISDGLLSQVRDTGEGYYLHQISAPISHGSSGSPVFNQKGEVIGLATLSYKEGQNLNFSVPINYARGMALDGPGKISLREFANSSKQLEPTLGNQPEATGAHDDSLKGVKIAVVDSGKALELSTEGQRLRAMANRLTKKTLEEELQRIQNEMIAIIDMIAKEKGYILVFDLKTSGIVTYYSPTEDITHEIVSRYDLSKR